MELKNYQRATANELDSILLRIGIVKNQPSLFPKIYDEMGNVITADQLTKANEITGAGIEYITSVCEYVYTNFLPQVKKKRDEKSLYDTLPAFDWEAFLDIASGGIAGQRERIQRTVMQYQAKPKTVLMIDTDGNLHSRWPFVLDYEWEDTRKLDIKTASRFERLNQAKGGKIDSETGTTIQRLPIRRVTVMAAKPLFEAFFKKSPSTYSFPSGMYAKMYHHAKVLRKELERNNETVLIGYETDLLDTNTSVSAYARYARYMMRHNNLTGAEMKNKNYRCTIRHPALKFLKSVHPTLIKINGRNEQHIEKAKLYKFLSDVQQVYLRIEGFKFFPVFEGFEDKNGKAMIVFSLYTSRYNAIERYEATKKINNKGKWRFV